MKFFTRSFLIFISILGISSDTVAQFQTGDVFVGVASGSVQWRRPNGTLVQTLNGGAGGFTTGMAFDSAQSLYVTNFSNSIVHRFDKNGVQISNFGSGYSTPECIVFDGSWNAYVGNIGGGFRKYDALGNFISTVAGGTRIDFADLQADQSTMLYTQEGNRIGRWDVVNNVALTDFATGLGGQAYALRIRSNGDVLLANGANVIRLNSAGTVVQTYDVTGENSWFAINLDPDSTSFWSADFSSANVYRIEIATGNVISQFNTGTGSNVVFGLTVAGEITVATQFIIHNPSPYAKWISGETFTISWDPLPWANVNIKCIINTGTSVEQPLLLAFQYPGTFNQFPWNVPDTLLSYRSKIVIENAANPTQKIESGIFRIKPYLLTRVDVVNSDSIYYEYRKNRDQWGFWNDRTQLWPETWYQQFDYRGIDPFTNSQYSQWQGNSVFLNAQADELPDWVSWVNTFTTTSCYSNLPRAEYSAHAMDKWRLIKAKWNGLCFGIAISNAIIFRNKADFFERYPTYTSFTNPIDVTTSNVVKRTISEIWTHQFGDPHLNYFNNELRDKTPNQTLQEIKDMLRSEASPIRILGIVNNGGNGGGHIVNVYKLIRDKQNSDIYKVFIYDNSDPTNETYITVNTLGGNNGSGSWTYRDMGGDRFFILSDIVTSYLSNPNFHEESAFNENVNTNDSVFQFFNDQYQDFLIYDSLGNKSGSSDDLFSIEIPNSIPKMIHNGSENPPYGFDLYLGNYKVIVDNFRNATMKFGLVSGIKSFSYSRNDANISQTDRLYFDGSLTVSNPDTSVKSVIFSNLIDETSHEKLFEFSSLEMAQNDSVRIENLGSDNFKLTSYGSSTNYDIELNFVSQALLGRFMNLNIALPSNTSHTFLPAWNNVTTSQLVILEDIGNNGTIEDTLRINNIITNLEEGLLSMPDRYSLAQNYPNPFNPSTLIKFNIKSDGLVTLKVYDVLGKEVATLVNELKQSGRYEAEFNGSSLGSGIYYYRLQAGEYSETRKMLLLK